MIVWAASAGSTSASVLPISVGREAGRGVVHPGEAHVLVLAEHGDGRAAQRDLEALLGLSQFLGARLDALLKLMPRFFQFVEGAQMRGDLGLEPVARGKPQQAAARATREEVQRRRRARRPQPSGCGRGAEQPRQPKRGERDKMRKADRDHEKREERDHGHHVRTMFASLALDVDQSGGDGEEGECEETVGQEIEPFEP